MNVGWLSKSRPEDEHTKVSTGKGQDLRVYRDEFGPKLLAS